MIHISIQALSQQVNDDRLFWYVRLFRIRCWEFAHSTDRKGIIAYTNAESEMEQCPEAIVRAAYYCYYGQLCYAYRDFDKAFKLLFRARNMFEKIGYANIPEAVEYLCAFGRHYYGFEDYPKAVAYLEQALTYPNQEIFPSFNTLNTLGMAYQRLKQYQKAEQAFRKVVEEARKANDKDYVGIGIGNLGNTLRLMGKNRDALPYLYADLAMNETTVPENSAITCLYIAQALMALDSTTKAQTFIDRARRLKSDWNRTSYPLYYYETQTLYYKKMGDYRRVAAYLDSTVLLKDSLRVVFSNRILANAESRINAELYLSGLRQAETEKKFTLRLGILIVVALLVFGAALVYGLNQKRRALQQEQQAQAARREQAEAQLVHAQAQLDQYLENLKAKNELIGQISEELASVRRETTALDSTQIAGMTALLDSVIQTDKDWLRFRQLFEQVYPGFLDKLYQYQPDLNPAEVRLLALLKLNIPTKEMGYMLGVSAETIRKSRYRLRKKLDLPQADSRLRALIEQL